MTLVDLMLDTYICNGHTTTSDALYVGVPVLTCKGKHFASRVAASILTTANLTQLITSDLTEYTNRAIEIATCSNLMAEIKNKINVIKNKTSLFNTAYFCKNLEKIYQDLYESKGPR